MIEERVLVMIPHAKPIEGKIILVFTDAKASGTCEYIPVTYCLLKTDDGIVYTIRPRDIVEVKTTNKKPTPRPVEVEN